MKAFYRIRHDALLSKLPPVSRTLPLVKVSPHGIYYPRGGRTNLFLICRRTITFMITDTASDTAAHLVRYPTLKFCNRVLLSVWNRRYTYWKHSIMSSMMLYLTAFLGSISRTLPLIIEIPHGCWCMVCPPSLTLPSREFLRVAFYLPLY